MLWFPFCVHHTAVHQFTVSFHTKWHTYDAYRSALGRSSRLGQIKMLPLVELCALLVLFFSIIFDQVGGSIVICRYEVSQLWRSWTGIRRLLPCLPPPRPPSLSPRPTPSVPDVMVYVAETALHGLCCSHLWIYLVKKIIFLSHQRISGHGDTEHFDKKQDFILQEELLSVVFRNVERQSTLTSTQPTHNSTPYWTLFNFLNILDLGYF